MTAVRDLWDGGPNGCGYSESLGRWVCGGLPPEPWPALPPGGSWPLETYGPGGTLYLFSADQAAERAGFSGDSNVDRVVRFLRKLGVRRVEGSASWSVPYVWADPALPVEVRQMRWIHTTIVGTIGTDEQVAHTFNWRTNPVADVAQDAAAIQTFANQVRDAWVAFLNATGPGGLPVKQSMPTTVRYTEVRAAYLEQTAPAEIGSEPGKTGPRKTFDYPRPTYLVPTQYAAFAANVGGTSTAPALPYEVACAISLRTAQRGPRNRGRFYWGPLTSDLMGDSGNFDQTKIRTVATAFQTAFVTALNTGSGNRLHVVSRAYATSEGVNGVRVGVVPDSQRRRRRSRPETYGPIAAT